LDISNAKHCPSHKWRGWLPPLLCTVILNACAAPAPSPTSTPTAQVINSRQVAIEAVEDFLSRETRASPEDYRISLDQTGLLTNTYVVSVQRKDCSFCLERYVVARSGEITPLNLDQLVMAYIGEQVSVDTHGSMKEIALSLIELYDNWGAVVISSVNDIPEYDSHPLDADLEAIVRPPWTYEDEDGVTYWIGYTYTQNGGFVRRYKCAFRDGNVANPTEMWVLGRDIGDALYPE
jgi:hypothetical protein